jgi:hypothetical protein
MKKLLWLALLLAFLPKAHAGTCPSLSSGSSQNTISSALTNCYSAGGGTVTFAAGTYGPFNSTLNIPCGVSLTGPTVAYSQTHYQTAILEGTSSFDGPAFQTTAACSASQAISYLEWNGEHPSAGGGFLSISANTQNLTVNNNFLHGANGPAYPGNTSEAQIYFAGGNSNQSTPTQNVTITLNEFGPEGAANDCGSAMTETNTEGGGGYCAGILFNAFAKNITVTKNIFHYLEQGGKVIETTTNGGSTLNSGNVNNLVWDNNDFSYIQRIPFETQSNWYSTAFPTLEHIEYNSLGNRYNGSHGQQNFDLSIANGCGNPPATAACTATMLGNVDIQNVNNSTHGAGNEFWGDSNSSANYNLFEGYVAGAGGAIDWAQSGAFNFNNNTFNIFSGSGRSTNCQSPNGGYWNSEDSPASLPTCSTGNSYSSTGSGTYTSNGVTITPSGGAVSSGTVLTISAEGSNRDANTSAWCTTDGSSPVPGSGTATIMTSYTVTGDVTLKCVGMWGAVNQPYSYPSGYGYVPSSVFTAAYTLNGNPTIISGYLGDPGSVNTLAVGATPIQFTAYVYYSNDTGPAALPDSYGNTAVWSSSNSAVLSVGSTGLVSCTTTGTANVQVNVNTSSGLRLNVWTMTCTAPAGPTITGGYLGNPGSVNTLAVGAPAIQFTATAKYGNGTYATLPDKYGNTAVWSSSNSSVLAVGSSGLVSCTTTGVANVQVNVNTSTGVRLNVWTMTCN